MILDKVTACSLIAGFSIFLGSSLCLQASQDHKPLKLSQALEGPWWIRQTALTPEGSLSLKNRSWWPRAEKLSAGQSFIIKTERPGKNRMLVRCERFNTRSRKNVKAILWVIDDDENGSCLEGGDNHSDCYTVDYDCDGVVDRMVDYIDSDNDKDPDEMDIRYFTQGRLNYSWFGLDLDDDSSMWSLRGYEYGGPSFFESDPYGNNMIYMNKLNPEKGTWTPISECPFAFYDTDHDGFSEVAARFSAVPLDYDLNAHPDYANSSYRLRWDQKMKNIGVVNVRYSFDIDGGSCKKNPLHYEMGFNMVGSTPYRFPGMEHYNPKRRPPQVTRVVPWENVRDVCRHYYARETGFSWHENVDDTLSIGYGRNKTNDRRWEGVFWIWERRFMENTGGPSQKWNVRREWSPKETSERRLYYSKVDQRIHLFGAREGWIQVGRFCGVGTIGEIRMFDTDSNGFFDRWEVYLEGNPLPVRVTTVKDERTEAVSFDLQRLQKLYTDRILPEAMAANKKIIAAMDRVHHFKVPENLQKATKTGPANYRRYAQDIVKEICYQKLRKFLLEKANGSLKRQRMNDLRKTRRSRIDVGENSYTAWKRSVLLSKLDAEYGRADYDRACRLLSEIKSLMQNKK